MPNLFEQLLKGVAEDLIGDQLDKIEQEIDEFLDATHKAIRSGDAEGILEATILSRAYVDRIQDILRKPALLGRDPFKDLRGPAQRFIDHWKDRNVGGPYAVTLRGHTFRIDEKGLLIEVT